MVELKTKQSELTECLDRPELTPANRAKHGITRNTALLILMQLLVVILCFEGLTRFIVYWARPVQYGHPNFDV